MDLLDKQIIRNANIAWRSIEGEALLIDSRQSLIYPLNDVGTLVWEMLDGKNSVNRIIEALCEEFQADTELIRKDAVDFIEGLISLKLADLTRA